jgi:hypothetical protein
MTGGSEPIIAPAIGEPQRQTWPYISAVTQCDDRSLSMLFDESHAFIGFQSILIDGEPT